MSFTGINCRSIKVIWIYSCSSYRLPCSCTCCSTFCCRSTKRWPNSESYKTCPRRCSGSRIMQSTYWSTPFSVALFTRCSTSWTRIIYLNKKTTVSTEASGYILFAINKSTIRHYFSYFNDAATVLWHCLHTVDLRFRTIVHINVEFVLISVVLLSNIQWVDNVQQIKLQRWI